VQQVGELGGVDLGELHAVALLLQVPLRGDLFLANGGEVGVHAGLLSGLLHEGGEILAGAAAEGVLDGAGFLGSRRLGAGELLHLRQGR